MVGCCALQDSAARLQHLNLITSLVGWYSRASPGDNYQAFSLSEMQDRIDNKILFEILHAEFCPRVAWHFNFHEVHLRVGFYLGEGFLCFSPPRNPKGKFHSLERVFYVFVKEFSSSLNPRMWCSQKGHSIFFQPENPGSLLSLWIQNLYQSQLQSQFNFSFAPNPTVPRPILIDFPRRVPLHIHSS